MLKLIRWLQEMKLVRLKRRLAGVEAELAQERAYLPTVYPISMSLLVRRQAELRYDIDRLTTLVRHC